MMTGGRFERYRQLSAQLGEQAARALFDQLQVLALTQPDTLREIEAFIDHGHARTVRGYGRRPTERSAES